METSHESMQPPEHFDGIRKLIEAKHVDLKSELIRGQTLQDKIQDMTVQMDELNTSITSEVSVPTLLFLFAFLYTVGPPDMPSDNIMLTPYLTADISAH